MRLSPRHEREALASMHSNATRRYHRQFWEAAEAHYLRDDEVRRYRHRQMADFFCGVWAERAKPYSAELAACVQAFYPGEAAADRRVRPQPLVLRGASVWECGAEVNGRRCAEAAEHLLRGGLLLRAAEELAYPEACCARILRRESIQMALQVLLHLALGFGHESQAGLVADQAGQQAYREGSCIPERIKPAGPSREFRQSRLAPGQMIGLLPAGCQEHFAHPGVTGGQCLAVIEPLCGDLAGVVHPHQRRGLAALALPQRNRWRTRHRSTGLGGGQQGPQGAVGSPQ